MPARGMPAWGKRRRGVVSGWLAPARQTLVAGALARNGATGKGEGMASPALGAGLTAAGITSDEE